MLTVVSSLVMVTLEVISESSDALPVLLLLLLIGLAAVMVITCVAVETCGFLAEETEDATRLRSRINGIEVARAGRSARKALLEIAGPTTLLPLEAASN